MNKMFCNVERVENGYVLKIYNHNILDNKIVSNHNDLVETYVAKDENELLQLFQRNIIESMNQ